ncbi:MAG: hypothetical protein AAF488_14390 [Planctomycetota bacterium]
MIGWILSAALVAASPLPVAPGVDEFDVFDDARILGQIRVIAEDEDSVELKTRRGTVLVTGLLKAKRRAHTAKKLSEISAGSKVWVLGRKVDGQDLPLNGYPPHITAIAAMVTGSFDPPKITAEQRKLKLGWHSGSISEKDKKYKIDDFELSTGGTRIVVEIKSAKLIEFKKRRQLYVVGPTAPLPKPKDGEKKSKAKKHVKAALIAEPAKKVPAAEYKAILGI